MSRMTIGVEIRNQSSNTNTPNLDIHARFERFYRDWLRDYARINKVSPELVHESIHGRSLVVEGRFRKPLDE